MNNNEGWGVMKLSWNQIKILTPGGMKRIHGRIQKREILWLIY